MTRLRLVFLTVIAVVLVALTAAWSGTSTPTPASLDRSPLPMVRSDGELGSTWFCAAGTAAVAASHSVILSNPTDRPVGAHLTGYTATGATPTSVVEVPARGPLVIDVGPTLGDPTMSVLIESTSPVLTVDHQLVSDDGASRDACLTSTSDAWFFPALTSTADAGVRLTLFNPFPGDAGVDIAIGLDTGSRVPSSLTGVVIPGGTSKVIDLGQSASRREQFTATVRARSGRVLAEVVQTFDGSKGPRGIRMATGVPAPARGWTFAGGFTGAGAAEHLVIQNPGTTPLHALVQVTPYGAAAQPPEPLQIDVEAGRYVVADLSAESRIPGIGYHAIVIEADHAFVAARTISLSGPPEAVPDPAIVGRPALDSGTALATGSSVASSRWVVPSIDAGADPQPVVLVHNPGAGIAVVTLRGLAGGSGVAIERAAKAEIAPGDSLAVPLPALAPEGGEATVIAESTEPVVIERLTTYPAQRDLAFNTAVPVADAVRPLVRLGPR